MLLLLTLTAVVEAATGVALLLAPSAVVGLLLGSPLDSAAGLVVGRVLGSALFALGLACGLARSDIAGRAATGLIAAMLVYNLAASVVLAHAWIGMGMWGLGLVPAVLLHAALLGWCVACLVSARGRGAECQSDQLAQG